MGPDADLMQSGWGDATCFSNPANTNNTCTSDQKSGFDWAGLKTGGFSSYNDFSFSGFSCADSFGKRDLLPRTGSGFQVRAPGRWPRGAGSRC